MTGHPTARALAAGAAALGLLLAAPPAAADQDYRTQRIAVGPVAGSTGSGTVINIHTEGPVNYGIERYQLRGATPGTTYFVALTIYRDADCTVPEPGLRFPTASFTTNRAGNGSAGATFSAAAVARLISEPDVLDARWTFSTGAEAGAPVAYETDCVQITVDVPPVAAAPAP